MKFVVNKKGEMLNIGSCQCIKADDYKSGKNWLRICYPGTTAMDSMVNATMEEFRDWLKSNDTWFYAEFY